MLKLSSILACAAFALSTSASATTLHYDVDAYANTTGGGVGAVAHEGVLNVFSGQKLVFNTDPSQVWHGAVVGDGNYGALTTNASGVGTSWGVNLNGASSTVGTLVASIDGEFRNVGAGTVELDAWNSGQLQLWYADTNQSDNSGVIQSTVDVPEPVSLALLGIGLGGMGFAGRRGKRRA